jgi:hypothetical protein
MWTKTGLHVSLNLKLRDMLSSKWLTHAEELKDKITKPVKRDIVQ